MSLTLKSYLKEIYKSQKLYSLSIILFFSVLIGVSAKSILAAPLRKLLINSSNQTSQNEATQPNEKENKKSDFTATAYCLKGRTASGTIPQRGTVAADLRVLPLGSLVRLHAGNYSGVYKVQDTGKKIRGNRIDVYIPTKSEAIKFGKKKIKVEFLPNDHPLNK